MLGIKKMNGLSYIVQSAVGLGTFAVLAAIVSVEALSAVQLSWLTRAAICGLLWGLLVWFVIILRRFYKALPDE